MNSIYGYRYPKQLGVTKIKNASIDSDERWWIGSPGDNFSDGGKPRENWIPRSGFATKSSVETQLTFSYFISSNIITLQQHCNVFYIAQTHKIATQSKSFR
jgi:hypothetical protein